MNWLYLLIIILSLAGCVTGGATVPNITYYTISSGDTTIRASSRYAGAIDSLIWRGKEFIDRVDQGRGLQSASSFDGYGECYNPTEAGSGGDNGKSVSSSVLTGIVASGNILKTSTKMAFWVPPGKTAPGCGLAKNTTIVSGHILSKEVKITPNVIEYRNTFYISEPHNEGTFEVLTGYMPVEFSSFWSYNPETGILLPLSDGPGEQFYPVIFSSSKSYAMGIYAMSLNHYGRFRFWDTVKWNVVERKSPIQIGNYSFESYVFVGTLEDVKIAMTKTYNLLEGQ